MKEATTIAHPQPPSSTLVDGAMVLMLLLPSGICYSFDRGGVPGNNMTNNITDIHLTSKIIQKMISEVHSKNIKQDLQSYKALR